VVNVVNLKSRRADNRDETGHSLSRTPSKAGRGDERGSPLTRSLQVYGLHALNRGKPCLRPRSPVTDLAANLFPIGRSAPVMPAPMVTEPIDRYPRRLGFPGRTARSKTVPYAALSSSLTTRCALRPFARDSERVQYPSLSSSPTTRCA